MTVKVAGMWELGWNTPILEVDLWMYPLRDYGVDEFFMSPVSGIAESYVTEVHNIMDTIAAERDAGCTIVYVDEKGEEDLAAFQHPENVLYVFGKASTSLIGYKTPLDRSVRITTPNNLATLWPHQAAVLVLHDRVNKGK
jgi:tRNA(Leu) C34 or U34 (ribose-2'-O)-methylase TrmL